jgi:ATP-dependent DNA helicase RecG
MSLYTFEELFEKLRSADESLEIEAKRATEVGKSAPQTISAFANEPTRGGGYLVCGVALQPTALFLDYEIVGVPDPDKLQRELATKCATMFSVPIRPIVWTERRAGKTVVMAFIPEAQPHEKPVFIKSQGLPEGAYRRIASTDLSCTDEDLELFYQQRDRISFDESILPDTSPEDFDPNAITAYRRARGEANPSAAELTYTDEELLHALCATSKRDGKSYATIAGMLLFGKSAALRRHFPMMRVDYILAPGRKWVSDPDNRYEGVKWREALMTLIPRVVSHVMEDIPKAFSLGEGDVQRREIPRIPQKVIREAVVNALMHRSYRTKQPVQIIRYANRIEFRNPGHSLKPEDRLGAPGSISRNEKIAAVLHETLFAETKGTGIRTMRKLMDQSKLTAPFFESDREMDTFVATFLPHHLFGEEDYRWLTQFQDCDLTDDEARALVVVREVGAMNNAYYRTLSGMDTLAASRHLQRLRDIKLLTQKGKSSATYYVPGERFIDSLQTQSSIPDSGLSGKPSIPDKPLSGNLGIPDKRHQEESLPEGFPPLPAALVQTVVRLGKRATPREVRDVIIALCGWRDLRPPEIAVLIGRSLRHTQDAYLYAMVRDHELEPIQEDPQHPKQAYRTPRTTTGTIKSAERGRPEE